MCGSITILIERLQCGDEQAAQQLFNRYFTQLLRVAANKLGNSPRTAEDEEDVVMSAMKSFIHRTRNHQFPRLSDRCSLWPLLFKITERKAINQRNRQLAQKRKVTKADLEPDEVEAPIPTPQKIVELQETCQALFNKLENETLRTVAKLKLQGFTHAEIAVQLDCVERTVERKIRVIRNAWLEDSG